ncbi:MAG: CbiX/SirB N-terminal domain-containing protein [Desulfobacterota bacterium]|nr:CbiX/SirB N-terminal domain-containing protein [Thermodesulfobacteriota bacterium]
MEAIILLGHGSRVPEAGQGMARVAERLKEKYDYPLVEVCFMSRLGPHFPETLAQCVRQGASRVVVIPYFLHTGLHILLDIPEMMQEEAEKYPQVEIVFGRSLGFDESLVDLVNHCIRSSEGCADVRELVLPPKEKFPIPPGQAEFVPMAPEEAEIYRKNGNGRQQH